MWTFARGSENILITSETTGWKLQPVVSLRVITTYDTVLSDGGHNPIPSREVML